MNRNSWLLWVIVWAILAMGLVACQSPTADSEADMAVVRSFYEALNNGDGDAALALLREDAVFEMPAGTYRGLAEIEIMTSRFVDRSGHAETNNYQSVDGQVTHRSEWFEGDRFIIRYDAEAMVQDGKIQSLKVTWYCGPVFGTTAKCDE